MRVYDCRNPSWPRGTVPVVLLDGEVVKFVRRVEIDAAPDDDSDEGPGRVTFCVKDENGRFVVDRKKGTVLDKTITGMVKVLFAPKSPPADDVDQPTIVGG